MSNHLKLVRKQSKYHQSDVESPLFTKDNLKCEIKVYNSYDLSTST